MQMIGPIVRKVLADAKRAMEERKALAGSDAGAGTNCSSKDVCPCVSLEKSGLAVRNNGPHAIDASPQFSQPREDGCDPVASKGFSGNGLVCGQVDGNRQNAGPREEVPVFATPCPRTDAMKVSSGFTVRIVNRNARQR
jgi:hypothetical protein